MISRFLITLLVLFGSCQAAHAQFVSTQIGPFGRVHSQVLYGAPVATAGYSCGGGFAAPFNYSAGFAAPVCPTAPIAAFGGGFAAPYGYGGGFGYNAGFGAPAAFYGGFGGPVYGTRFGHPFHPYAHSRFGFGW